MWIEGEDMSEPKLKKIDLSLGGPNHDHPYIECGPTYLVKHRNKWYVGHFNKQWYGLNFNCGFGVSGSVQYDTPGYNSSGWQECYLIEESNE